MAIENQVTRTLRCDVCHTSAWHGQPCQYPEKVRADAKAMGWWRGQRMLPLGRGSYEVIDMCPVCVNKPVQTAGEVGP